MGSWGLLLCICQIVQGYCVDRVVPCPGFFDFHRQDFEMEIQLGNRM